MSSFAFDFERGLEKEPAQPVETAATRVKNYRMTVCRHWLRGLCMKGNSCGFLHQFEAARMPVCRFFAKYGECKARAAAAGCGASLTQAQEPDCPFKHSSDDIKDCNMYKLGFCIHGPNCRFRHLKQSASSLPTPEQAHLTVTRPGRPGSEVLMRPGWGNQG